MPHGCDIYAYDPATGRENRYSASTRSHSELHPTYWRGHMAFVRYYGSGADPRPVVYTRRGRPIGVLTVDEPRAFARLRREIETTFSNQTNDRSSNGLHPEDRYERLQRTR